MIYNGYNRRLERWIINHQTGRRNLTKSQLVKAYASVEEQLKREAKERQGERNDLKNNIVANLPQSSDKKRNAPTTEVVAKKLGVSRKTYEGMKTVVAEGSAEQIERMDRGGKGNSVSAIAKKAKEKEQERKTTYQKSEKSSMPTMNTAKEVAKIAGVSHDTIHMQKSASGNC